METSSACATDRFRAWPSLWTRGISGIDGEVCRPLRIAFFPHRWLSSAATSLTAVGNDFSFDEIFSRQIEALARAGDLLTVHTTSGHSPNCLRVVEVAKRLGVRSIALTSRDSGKIRAMADRCLVVLALAALLSEMKP